MSNPVNTRTAAETADQAPAATMGFKSLSDVEAFSNQMVQAMNELSEVVEAETDFIKAGKLVGALGLQSEKTRCAEIYIRMLMRAKQQAAIIKAFSPELAKRISSTQETFRKGLSSNLNALGAARDVSEGLIKGVAEGLAKQEAPTTYGANAHTPAPSSAPVKGIAINTTL